MPIGVQYLLSTGDITATLSPPNRNAVLSEGIGEITIKDSDDMRVTVGKKVDLTTLKLMDIPPMN